jgi:hypothetical protein
VDGIVVGANAELFSGDVIGNCEVDLLPAVCGDLEAIEDNVIVAAFETGNESIPLVLHEDCPSSESPGERVSQIDLETDGLPWVLWVLEDERRPTLRISAPTEVG